MWRTLEGLHPVRRMQEMYEPGCPRLPYPNPPRQIDLTLRTNQKPKQNTHTDFKSPTPPTAGNRRV